MYIVTNKSQKSFFISISILGRSGVKVESIRTQYSDYASFKIVAPISLKNKLLNKDNWVENIFSSILFETSLLLVF